MNRGKLLVLDTNMLCCWLQVPGKDCCGTVDDRWDYERVKSKIEEEQSQNTSFVLPMATVIETGNHIAQSNGNRYEIAKRFADIMRSAAEKHTPWIAFDEQVILWGRQGLLQLADELPEAATRQISMGDMSISTVANFYSESGYAVEIFTADAALKSLEPIFIPPVPAIEVDVPRRRKDRNRK